MVPNNEKCATYDHNFASGRPANKSIRSTRQRNLILWQQGATANLPFHASDVPDHIRSSGTGDTSVRAGFP